MKMIVSFMFTLSIAVMSLGGNALAQSTRSYVNKGVNLYHDGKYVDSEVEFKKGLDKAPNNFQANFNLGDSYYKQGNYSDAMKLYQSALAKVGKNNELKSKVYHNIGNVLLKDQKIKESIAAYTDALKLNPDDMSTKYNLSYALDMLKNKKNQDKNQQNKNDKNNQNNKNQNNNQNKNQQNQNKNQQNNQQQNQQQQQDQMSKAQAQAIFAALNHDEQKLQKKLRKFVGKPTKIAKDW
ncbi:MAG: tetratricopeptide repeat protein [Bacteroidetes bacterium]|nr:tetratricopeptide repeat protein [Bacteroidota bacterium]